MRGLNKSNCEIRTTGQEPKQSFGLFCPLLLYVQYIQMGNDWVGCGVLPLTFVSSGCLWNRSR